MKKIFGIILISAVAAVACTKTEKIDDRRGMGILNVDMTVAAQTKAALTQEELYNTAKVNIYKSDFSGLVRSYTYAQMPSPFYLAADEYRVDVEAGECVKDTPAIASWEQKSYKGSETFTIVAGQVQNVKVEATVNNAVTCITFDPTIAENFSEGYEFSIALDSDPEASKLIYDASKSGAEGYYIVAGLVEPSFEWTFTGTLIKGGNTFTKEGTIKNIVPGKLYKMNLKYTIKDGDLDFVLEVDKTTDVVNDNIVFEPVSTGLSASKIYEFWATKATLHADVDPEEYAGATIKFAYKNTDETEWSYEEGLNDAEGTWKAELTGLTPSKEYTYKLLINDVEVGDALTFTTEAAPNLPNASFEYTSLVTGADYYKFYDPDCGVEEGIKMFWGSGNGEGPDGVNGSANVGAVITKIDKEDYKDGKQSVLAVNGVTASMLTAGNIFAGQFREIQGTSGGIVDFGRPWTSRPTALRLWAKYKTGLINVNASKLPESAGLTSSDYDRAHIKIAIGNWNYSDYNGFKANPIGVNTSDKSTWVDFYDDAVDKNDGKRGGTIANGDLVIMNDGYQITRGAKKSANTSEWIQYEIPLVYYSEVDYPTHIVISCSASQYGDYFAGCSTAELKLDGFELIY